MNMKPHVTNGRLYSGDRPFRFVGTNMYELAYVDSERTQLMLENAAKEGFTVVRFWAFSSMPSEKLLEICRTAEHLQLKLIPVLADMNEYLQGFKVNDDWFRSGYMKEYLPHAESVAGKFAGCNEILLIELFNEPAVDNFDVLYDFTIRSADAMKRSDGSRLLSMGTIGGIGDRFGGELSRFDHGRFRKLYSVPSLDLVSIHDYSFSATALERADLYFRLKSGKGMSKLFNKLDLIFNSFSDLIDTRLMKSIGRTFSFPLTVRNLWRIYNEIDYAVAGSLNKPVYVGEIGIKKKYGEARKGILKSEVSNHFRNGAAGVLLWSFETMNASKDGHDYGFSESDGLGSAVTEVFREISKATQV